MFSTSQQDFLKSTLAAARFYAHSGFKTNGKGSAGVMGRCPLLGLECLLLISSFILGFWPCVQYRAAYRSLKGNIWDSIITKMGQHLPLYGRAYLSIDQRQPSLPVVGLPHHGICNIPTMIISACLFFVYPQPILGLFFGQRRYSLCTLVCWQSLIRSLGSHTPILCFFHLCVNQTVVFSSWSVM